MQRAKASNPHDALFKRVFSDVTHAAGEFRAVLPAELPDVGFLLDDLSKQTDDALYARAMTTLARLVLWSLRTARGGRLTAGTFAM